MRKIKVKNGMKSFGSQTVLDSVNIQCESGHIYGIVGHNGSGKTVLFKCICGFMNLDAGEIEIDGVKYSMGMRQRLAIAQAIMENQEILILDEPMNGLDHKGVEEMRELFLGLKRAGKLILLASHNREDIDILCDAVYEMEMGKLKRIRG